MTRALAGLRLAGRAIERAAPGRPGVGWDSALGAGRHDSADGFATVALVLRASLDHGDWPERLSYDSDEQRRVDQARMRSIEDQPRPTGQGFGLGTLAERARRARQ